MLQDASRNPEAVRKEQQANQDRGWVPKTAPERMRIRLFQLYPYPAPRQFKHTVTYQLWQHFLQLFGIHLVQVLCLRLPRCPCCRFCRQRERKGKAVRGVWELSRGGSRPGRRAGALGGRWPVAPDEAGSGLQLCRRQQSRSWTRGSKVLGEEAGAHRSKAGARVALCAHLERRPSATRPSAAARHR